MSEFTVEQILGQLDASAAEYTFPNLGHGYYYAVDTRLHAYRDDRRWSLIVETVGYSPRAASLDDVLHVYGNCLTRGAPGFRNDDFLDRIENFDEVVDDDGYTGQSLVIRGNVLSVPGRRGEDEWDVFRRLVPEHRDLLLADEEELRARIPADLPEILRLEEWRQEGQPNDDNRPSQWETFRMLADVLVSGDPARYAPTRPPNSHWSDWPESGAL